MTDVLILIAGFIVLTSGGEALVRGSVAVAQQLRISPLVIGLTLVGFGTSMPELATTIQAVLKGSPDVAFGNVIGSNISNILLILGFAALVLPIKCDPTAFRRDGTAFALSQVIMVSALLLGFIGRPVGALLLLCLFAYLFFTYWSESRIKIPAAQIHTHEGEVFGEETKTLGIPMGIFVTIAGIVATVFGARLIVTGATSIAAGFGVPEAVIGLTIVAIGTSLPELASAIMASAKGESELAFGNVIGSNIFNSLGILGTTALVQPLAVPERIIETDLWVMALVSVLLVLFAITSWGIDRREGIILLIGYAGYLGFLALTTLT